MTAWYGWREVGTDASLNSITCRSTTRGARAGPITSTVVAQPDLTRQPTTARPRTRASSSPKRNRAARGLPPAPAAACRRSGAAWWAWPWRPWRRSSSPRRPAGAYGPLIERADRLVQTGPELEQAVAPHGDDSTRNEHAPRLRVEAGAVEPVQRLGDRHQLHGPRRQPARVRGRLAIAHAGV